MILSIVQINTKQGVVFMYFHRLRDLREDKDMTQSNVADMLGIKQTVYSRYERGFQNIPIELLLIHFYCRTPGVHHCCIFFNRNSST